MPTSPQSMGPVGDGVQMLRPSTGCGCAFYGFASRNFNVNSIVQIGKVSDEDGANAINSPGQGQGCGKELRFVGKPRVCFLTGLRPAGGQGHCRGRVALGDRQQC